MRKIILDTETTGLDFINDRIIEIGCIELVNDIPTGKKYHSFFSPGSVKISEQAEKIHGLSNDFLKKYQLFEDKINEIIEFLQDSKIIIHNAAFDLTMINNSLNKINKTLIKKENVICTLMMARKMFPGTKVNLNALCKKFEINIENREKHDAITDCFLLAQVYLELIGGRQHKISFENNLKTEKFVNEKGFANNIIRQTPSINLTENEKNFHEEVIKKINNPIWKNF